MCLRTGLILQGSEHDTTETHWRLHRELAAFLVASEEERQKILYAFVQACILELEAREEATAGGKQR